jgi:phosphatidylglycerol:prolipoprotein diacylglycerol transferase
MAVTGLVGFFIAVTVAGFRAKRYGIPRSDPVYIGAFGGLGLFAGSVLLFALTQVPYLWQNWADYSGNFGAVFARLFGGMVFYGGLFGSVAGIYVYCRLMKISFPMAMELGIPVFPLAHAFMRLGCFAGGCCHGIEFPPPLGITFTQSLGSPNGVPLLPVQLYEAFINILIFAVLWMFTQKGRHWITAACLYGTLYSFARFWIEFLRGDAIRGAAFGLSTSQWISLVLFALCIFSLCLRQLLPFCAARKRSPPE